MCGIIGIFGRKESRKLARHGIHFIRNRGLDSEGYYTKENFTIGHCLHSVVGAVKQPLIGNGVLSSNCEIYNWRELNNKYHLISDEFGLTNMIRKVLEKVSLSNEETTALRLSFVLNKTSVDLS